MLDNKSDEELWELLRDRHKRINDAAAREARAVEAGVRSPVTEGSLQPQKDRAIADTDAILDELEKRYYAAKNVD